MSGFLGLDELFEGRHFDLEVIILCVRWYLRFKLSYRDVMEMMAERGLPMAHTTIMRWVHRYVPEFERRWNRFARTVGRSWRVDDTYVKIRGQWVCLYRAVDREGHMVDFRLSTKRDISAAKAFIRKAIKSQGATPRTVTLDGYAASHRAVREMFAEQSLALGQRQADLLRRQPDNPSFKPAPSIVSTPPQPLLASSLSSHSMTALLCPEEYDGRSSASVRPGLLRSPTAT